MSTLVLGTAQLGMHYGISNKKGKPDQRTANAIIKSAWENNISEFDTAQAYGNSEEVLGHALRSLGIEKKARIISKLDPKTDHSDPEILKASVQRSIDRIGCDQMYGLMLHSESLLNRWHEGLGNFCSEIIKDRKAEHIGVSVYSPQKAMQALETDLISIVQIPANLLDRRFEKAGIFKRAKRLRKILYLRSVYLQGLLLIDPKSLPERMIFASQVLQKLKIFSEKSGYTQQELALKFCLTAYPDAKFVVGMETSEQVLQNILIMRDKLPERLIDQIKVLFHGVEEKVLNPVLWPT